MSELDVIKHYIDSALRWHPTEDGRGDNGLTQQETSDLLCKRLLAALPSENLTIRCCAEISPSIYQFFVEKAAARIEALEEALRKIINETTYNSTPIKRRQRSTEEIAIIARAAFDGVPT